MELCIHKTHVSTYLSTWLKRMNSIHTLSMCIISLCSLAVVKNLADVFYLCVLMMAYGPAFTRATIHGIIINTVQSVGSLPEVLASGKLYCEVLHRYIQIFGKGSA